MFFLKSQSEQEAFDAFDKVHSVADIIEQHIPTYKKRTAIRFDTNNTYEALNFEEYNSLIHSVIPFFARAEQQVVATFCKNRPEWDMVALATFYTGNILFPLDTKTNDVELKHLLELSPPNIIVTAFSQRARIGKLCEEAGVKPRFVIADMFSCHEDQGQQFGADLDAKDVRLSQISSNVETLPSLRPSCLLESGDTVIARYPTSGTTALPKVVQICHGAVVAEINEALDVINLRPNEELLNIGPYTHIATLVEFLLTKTRGFPVTYFTREPDEDDVLEGELRKLKNLGVRIKALMAVPKFWIYVMKELLDEMKNKPVLEKLYQHLTTIERNGKLYDIGTIEKAKLAAMRTLLRNKFGGYFTYGASSSMKLDGAVVEIFGKLGITVIDIYGATEVTGIISRNRLNDIKPGSCGRVIDCLEYKLRDIHEIPGLAHPVGELLVRGPTLLHSYVGQDRSQLIDEEGYYSTGDLAWVDEDRRVWLIGRRKELIRWDDGSYVDPQYLSNLLVRSIYVKDAMVVRINDDDAYLSVFLYPDMKRIQADARWKKLVSTGLEENVVLRMFAEEAIDYAALIADITAPLSKSTIYILPKALERTPTHKIKFLFERERIHLARSI